MLPKGVIFVLGPFWSAITCVGLGIIVYGIAGQLRSLSFQTAEGTIDTVKMTENSSGDGGPTYGIKISYHYDADGRRYIGNRLRFRGWSGASSVAKSLAERFGPGSKQPVYFNPAKPAEAVLIRGVQGQDLFLLLFITPFALVMLWIWLGAYFLIREPSGFSGLRVIDEGRIVRIAQSYSKAVAPVCVLLGLTSFLSIFVIGFFFGGFDPSLTTAIVAWCIVLVLPITAGATIWRSVRRGDDDIAIDTVGKILTAPGKLRMAFEKISRVEIVTRINRSPENGVRSRAFDVGLTYTDVGTTHRLKLEEWDSETLARRFAAWLAEQLGVPVQDGLVRDELETEIQLPAKWRGMVQRFRRKDSVIDQRV
jgi:hypothetical protein